MKGKAFLFGLNYTYDTSASLSGCINDVRNMAAYLQTELKIPCYTYTDDVNMTDTSAMGMLNKLYEVAMQTYKEDLDFVWIHYSGHGSYLLDTSGEENDGYDECLVPNDYKTIGVIPDDYLNSLFSYFNPKTRVIFVFDCCHSATMGDVKYSWEGPTKCAVENIMCEASSRIITISGCLDAQTSADAYNVLGDSKYVGALTACMLLALKENKLATWNNVFTLVSSIRDKLKARGFSQIPKLCSSYNLAKDPIFIPPL
jgi:hypothetical protein